MRYEATRRTLGDDHPATRAALGRWLEARGAEPQRGSVTPEAIAWHRASAANPGFFNRHHRRAMRQGGIRGYDP